MPFIETSEKRILFIHIPKTGGTSIEKAMENLAPLNLCIRSIPSFLKIPPEHFTYHNICALFDESFFDYTFTIVRNPYHRIESEYRMRSLLAQERFFKELPKFPFWLEQTLNQVNSDRNIYANHLRPQIEFIGKKVNVFRYEDGLENIVRKVNENTGIELSLPQEKLLQTQSIQAPIQWTSESVRMVNQFYAEDFKAFSYQAQNIEFIHR